MNGVTPQKGERDAILEVAKKSQLVSVLDVATGTVIIMHRTHKHKVSEKEMEEERRRNEELR